jgi:carboxylesterase type B
MLNTADETVLSQSLVDYWSNFAKTGNPNRASLEDDENESSTLLQWPQYSVGAEQSMHFATPNNYVQSNVLTDYCNVCSVITRIISFFFDSCVTNILICSVYVS